ncbi:hypothetical protein [Tumebacillus lipolyticus]|uniref:Uncharacterized protein n=1 Tax=Tumebacillus lipolyticus TaxID=1280370 RepID=A0ABW4ZZW8_9BACL
MKKKVALALATALSATCFMVSTAAATPAQTDVTGKSISTECTTKTYTLYFDEWDYVPNTMPYGGGTLRLQYFTVHSTYWKATYSDC